MRQLWTKGAGQDHQQVAEGSRDQQGRAETQMIQNEGDSQEQKKVQSSRNCHLLRAPFVATCRKDYLHSPWECLPPSPTTITVVTSTTHHHHLTPSTKDLQTIIMTIIITITFPELITEQDPDSDSVKNRGAKS